MSVDDIGNNFRDLKLEPDPSPPITQRKHTGRTINDVAGYIEEDGRTYHGWMAGEYSLPNDGEEQDRQDFNHAACLQYLNGKLGEAPVESPKYVLDIATGTGIWAIEFAEQNPDAQVVGTDLSLIQPFPRVPNCQFILENSETQDWLYPFQLDYIHLRFGSPCFNDFATVMQRAFNHSSPGGWIELQDIQFELQCIDDTAQGTALERWFHLVAVGGAKAGRHITKARYYKDYLLQAGYIDVVEKIYAIPGSPWPRDKHMKQMGRWTGHALHKSIDTYKKIIRFSGLSSEEVDELTTRAKEDVNNVSIHWYIHFYCVYGRKPPSEENGPPGEGFF